MRVTMKHEETDDSEVELETPRAELPDFFECLGDSMYFGSNQG